VPVTAQVLSERFPRLYHMAERGSWPSIRRHGLLSTSALLDLYEVTGGERARLEGAHRPESVEIVHPKHGKAVIRDQKPMDDRGLRRALTDGLMPEDWYRILNAKVFFWLTEDRLNRLLGARAYRDLRHDVLVVDTRELLSKHAGTRSSAWTSIHLPTGTRSGPVRIPLWSWQSGGRSPTSRSTSSACTRKVLERLALFSGSVEEVGAARRCAGARARTWPITRVSAQAGAGGRVPTVPRVGSGALVGGRFLL